MIPMDAARVASHGSRDRRRFLKTLGGLSVLAATLPLGLPRTARAVARQALGDGELLVVSDGHLTLPTRFIIPDSIDAAEADAFIASHALDPTTLTPGCNVTLWRHGDRLVMFDIGAGPNFMPTAGELPDNLAAAGIDPGDITDVVFTHAHPDHLWGLVDDFDELFCPDAAYHMAAVEWDFWRADDAIDKVDESRQVFVVGAQNRFAYLEDRIRLFASGDEVLPGVEAVDTRGHTPGHTSFALHGGGETAMIIGDALSNAALSFEKPDWPSGSDQDQEQGRATRLSLLDRLAGEQSLIVGYHLPDGGIGRVDRGGEAYRFVSP